MAVATAQYNQGQYNQGQYRPYDPFNSYKRNPYAYSTPSPFRPYVTSTLAPPTAYTRAPVYPSPAPLNPVKVYHNDARDASIVRYDNEIFPDGSYNYV